jgi:hypothetical protein
MEVVVGRLINEVSHSTITEERLELLTGKRSRTVQMNVYIADNDTLRISSASLQEVCELIEKSSGDNLRTWSVHS